MMKLLESVLFELKEVPGLRFLEPYWYQIYTRRNEALRDAERTRNQWNRFSHAPNALKKAREELKSKKKKSNSPSSSGSTARNVSHVPRNVKGSKKR